MTLRFSDYPIRLKRDVRDLLVENIKEIAKRVDITRAGGIAEQQVTDPRDGSSLFVHAVVLPVSSLAHGLRVTWETDAGPLPSAVAAVHTEVLSVVDTEQKRRQAQSMPTVLAVDIARLGPGWMRPPCVWAQELAAKIPQSCPFVGIAVLSPTLEDADSDMALAVSPSAAAEDRPRINALAARLGLDPL